MLLDGGVLLYIIMTCGKRSNQPQPCPVVAVPFDVFAAQNRSYQIRGAPMLFLSLAIGKDFIALSGADNKGIIAAGENAAFDSDIPIL